MSDDNRKKRNNNHQEEDGNKKDIIDKTNKKLNDFILDLKIISKIKPGNKLYVVENNIFIDDYYYLAGIVRFFTNQTRNDTIKYIEKLNKDLEREINNILEKKTTSNNLLDDNPSNVLVNLSHDLTQGINGLKNLSLSYASDNFTLSKIEMIIYNFELKIRKISEVLKI